MAYGTANCRDIRTRQAVSTSPQSLGCWKRLVHSCRDQVSDPSHDITDLIDSNRNDPPFSVREGGFIRDGYNSDIDHLRQVLSGGRGSVASFEAEERERTKIKSLKVGHNRVFGYYIEVRKSANEMIPDHYIRKQTLVDRERYITEELKELETTILTANERITALE